MEMRPNAIIGTTFEKGVWFMSFLTVIIPVKDSEKTLRQTLSSVACQTLCAHQAIVVDDGSETEACRLLTEEFSERYPGMFSYVRIAHGGPGRARNHGIALATTEYVTFLDGDDWWGQNVVEEIGRLLASCENSAGEIPAVDESEGAMAEAGGDRTILGAPVVQWPKPKKRVPDIIFTRPICYDVNTKKRSLFMDDATYMRVFYDEEIFCPDDRPEIFGLQVNANRMVLRREWLGEIGYAFSEGCRWEDVVPFYQAISAAKWCMGTTKAGFVYRVGQAGQATGREDASRLAAVPVFTEAMGCVMRNYRPELGAAFYHMMCEFLLWSLLNTPEEYRKQMADAVAQLFYGAPGVLHRDYLKWATRNRGVWRVQVRMMPPKDVAFLAMLLVPPFRRFLYEDWPLQSLRRLRR